MNWRNLKRKGIVFYWMKKLCKDNPLFLSRKSYKGVIGLLSLILILSFWSCGCKTTSNNIMPVDTAKINIFLGTTGQCIEILKNEKIKSTDQWVVISRELWEKQYR